MKGYTEGKMYKALVVEDDPIAKKLFCMYIENSGEFELAGAVETAGVAEPFCMGNRVDLILMDICTAGHSSGLDAAAKIKRTMPRIKIVIVTSQPEVGFIDRARAGGIDSFWYKTAEEAELLSVMRRTMDGESVYPGESPTVKLGLISSGDLTDLQIKILRELTGGETAKVIAAHLNLSEHTVNNNINIMLEKTGFPTRTKLACAAVESGIVIKGI